MRNRFVRATAANAGSSGSSLTMRSYISLRASFEG